MLTSAEVGRPDLTIPDGEDLRVVCSLDSSLSEALAGAQAAFLWDVALAEELREHWEWMEGVQWLHVAATGVERFSFEACAASPLVLTNAGGIYDTPIAEYALAACLAHERRFALLHEQQRAHEWRWLEGGMLAGTHVLIVGPGRIGRACAERFAALGCHVAALGSRRRAPYAPFEFVDASDDADAALGWADHIVITAPLTDATRGLLDSAAFSACKPGVHIVNVARGEIVNTAALERALADGRIGAATLDVLEDEPLAPDSPLWDAENVRITPHVAGDVRGFEGALIAQFERNVAHWRAGEPLECVVDKSRGY